MSTARRVLDKFDRRLSTGIEYHRELLLAVHMKKRQASLESILVEQFVLSSAVLWEVLISDLLLAYLVMGPSPYLKGVKQRVLQSVKDRFGQDVARCAKFRSPPTLSLERAQAFVDPKGYNVSVSNCDGLARRANELLEAQYAKFFALTSDDAQFIDFVIALRNYLGHRSRGARSTLRQAISPLSGPNATLNGPFKDSATFLKARIAGEHRSILVANRLRDVASKLG